MGPQTDRAIVLRLTEYSETSQIVTLFGAAEGLLRLIAKGARRSTKTRFAVGLDLLELGEVCFLPARGDAQLGTLTEWRQRDPFIGLRRDLVRLQAGLYAVELVAQLTQEADPHPELFDRLSQLLSDLSGQQPAAPLIPRFQIELLTAIGYAPELFACVDCRRPLRRSEPPSEPGAPSTGPLSPPAPAPIPGPLYFSSQAGGLLCRDCEPLHTEKRRLPPRLLGSPPESAAADWFELLDYHLSHVAGRRFQTPTVLGPLLRKGVPRV